MNINTSVHHVAKIDREIGYLGGGTQVITFKFRDQAGEVLYEVTAFAANNAANGHSMVEETRHKA
jgi:hypothetical protein